MVSRHEERISKLKKNILNTLNISMDKEQEKLYMYIHFLQPTEKQEFYCFMNVRCMKTVSFYKSSASISLAFNLLFLDLLRLLANHFLICSTDTPPLEAIDRVTSLEG